MKDDYEHDKQLVLLLYLLLRYLGSKFYVDVVICGRNLADAAIFNRNTRNAYGPDCW